MRELEIAAHDLLDSVRSQASPSMEGVTARARVLRRHRRMATGPAVVACLVLVAVLATRGDDDRQRLDAVTQSPDRTADTASDPEATSICSDHYEPVNGVTVVAAFTTTAGVVDSWMQRGGPGGHALRSSWTTGLPADAPVFVCFVDGDFHVGGPPGMPDGDRNRSVSFVDAAGHEGTMVIGPVSRIAVTRPPSG